LICVLSDPSVEQHAGLHLYPKQMVQPSTATTQGTSESMPPGGNAHRESRQQHCCWPPPHASGVMSTQLVSLQTQQVFGFFFRAGLISPQHAQAGLQSMPSHERQKTWNLVRQPLRQHKEKKEVRQTRHV